MKRQIIKDRLRSTRGRKRLLPRVLRGGHWKRMFDILMPNEIAKIKITDRDVGMIKSAREIDGFRVVRNKQ